MAYKHNYTDLLQVTAYVEKKEIVLGLSPVGTCYNSPLRGAWEFKMQYCDESLALSAEEELFLRGFIDRLRNDYSKSKQAQYAPFTGCAFLTVWRFTDTLDAEDILLEQQHALIGVLLDCGDAMPPFRFVSKEDMMQLPPAELFYYNAPE